MDPAQWIQLADAGAAAIVGAMATDAWNGVRAAITRMLGNGAPDRDESVGSWLEQQRQALLIAPSPDQARAAAALRAHVADLLLQRLTEEPQVAERLASLVTEFGDHRPGAVIQQATAAFGGQVNQAGRDVTVPPLR